MFSSESFDAEKGRFKSRRQGARSKPADIFFAPFLRCFHRWYLEDVGRFASGKVGWERDSAGLLAPPDFLKSSVLRSELSRCQFCLVGTFMDRSRSIYPVQPTPYIFSRKSIPFAPNIGCGRWGKRYCNRFQV